MTAAKWEAQHEHFGLVLLTLNRYFWGPVYCYLEDDLVAAGLLGLAKAERTYNPSKGAWSSWACLAIRAEMQAVRRQEAKHRRVESIALGDEDYQPPLLPRPLPEAPDWLCLNCRRPIDRDRQRITRGLCPACTRTRERVKKVHGGVGCCEVCGRVVRGCTQPKPCCKQGPVIEGRSVA